jgi:hypothetical protein
VQSGQLNLDFSGPIADFIGALTLFYQQNLLRNVSQIT